MENPIKNSKLHQFLIATTVFVVGGSAVHLFVMIIDYLLMPSFSHMDLRSDFFGSVMALAMLPMAITYGTCLLGVYFFWRKAKNALALAYKKEAQRREAEEVVQTMQRLTGILAEHLSSHNAEILHWVENRVQKTGAAPPSIERSSHKIAEAMKALTEVSFVSPYLGKRPLTVCEFETAFQKKLKNKSFTSGCEDF